MQVTLTREIARKLFRYLLIRARETAGRTGQDAAAAIGLRQPAYAQYEIGARRPDYAKLKVLLDFFELPDRLAIMADVLAVARQPREGEHYSLGLADSVELILALERYAARLDFYEPRVIHGLLQTPEYTRALLAGLVVLNPNTDLDTTLGWRMGRQTVLTRKPDPVVLTAYIDQSALMLPVGTPAVMADQMRLLLRRGRQPNITLRVVTGPLVHHPTGGRQLAVMHFTDRWRVGYAETALAAYYYDSAAELERCGWLMAHMHHVAAEPGQSLALVQRALDEWERQS